MVQMKVVNAEIARAGSCDLYIPHGSDESEIVWLCLFKPVYFISHMVQMKVAGKDMDELAAMSLYPTWFR